MTLVGRTLLTYFVTFILVAIGWLYFNGTGAIDRIVQVIFFLISIYFWYFYIVGPEKESK